MIYEPVWQPAPGVLFQLPETAVAVRYAICCEVPAATDVLTGEPLPPPTVQGYEVAITPVPPRWLRVLAAPSGVTVAAEALAGLFPIVFIDCLRHGKIERVYDWQALPEDADEVVAFCPSRERQREYQLTVTARLSDGEAVNAIYSLVILQDWTAGRDRLRREVDARRNQKG